MPIVPPRRRLVELQKVQNVSMLKRNSANVPFRKKLLIVVGICILFLIASVFQNFAWYHDQTTKDHKPFLVVLGISLLFVFGEYIFMLPANRLGSEVFTIFELGMISEVIAMICFLLFIRYYDKTPLTWKHFLAVSLVICGSLVVYI